MKNKDMPSIPILKLKLKKEIHKILFANWNEPIDLLNKIHRNKEIKYTTQETPKVTVFNI